MSSTTKSKGSNQKMASWLHTMVVQVERPWEFTSQTFGLWAWPLEASHYAWLKASILIFCWLFSTHFFGLSTKFAILATIFFSIYEIKNLAIQSHNLLTWMAIVWSGPEYKVNYHGANDIYKADVMTYVPKNAQKKPLVRAHKNESSNRPRICHKVYR
jgi:hypothetical protein